jgi:hypothetical protein
MDFIFTGARQRKRGKEKNKGGQKKRESSISMVHRYQYRYFCPISLSETATIAVFSVRRPQINIETHYLYIPFADGKQ